MATTYKILGKGSGGPAPASTIYTVPTGKYAVISSLSVSNNTAGIITSSVYLTPDAATSSSAANSLLYSVSIPAYSRTSYNLGMTLTAGETLKINGSNSCTLIVFGSESDV